MKQGLILGINGLDIAALSSTLKMFGNRSQVTSTGLLPEDTIRTSLPD